MLNIISESQEKWWRALWFEYLAPHSVAAGWTNPNLTWEHGQLPAQTVQRGQIVSYFLL